MLRLIRIKIADIALNKPIPYSVYDENGKLLLHAGAAITIPRYLDALLSHGAFFDRSEIELSNQSTVTKPDDKPKVFERVERLLLNLKHFYSTFFQAQSRTDLPKRIGQLAQELMQACGEDGDAALAALHLDQFTAYRIHHQLLCATVVELTARTMSLSDADRLPLVCAALTHDIALIEIGDILENTRTPLTLSQQALVRMHTHRGAEILANSGVTDALWLEAVAGHHELMDGSGYPQGVSGDKIGRGARLLAIADAYGAMIRSRPYRGNAYFPQNAMRELFLNQRKYVSALTQQTVLSIGMLPPGSVMRLQNGEIGVVHSRGSGATGARVFSIYNPAGMPLLTPVERNIGNSAYAIAGKVSFEECRSAEIIMRRLWTS